MLSEVRGQLWPLSSKVSDFPHEAKPLPKLPLPHPHPTPGPATVPLVGKATLVWGFSKSPLPFPLLAG